LVCDVPKVILVCFVLDDHAHHEEETKYLEAELEDLDEHDGFYEESLHNVQVGNASHFVGCPAVGKEQVHQRLKRSHDLETHQCTQYYFVKTVGQ
jgi:hypothetical protein